MPRGAVVLLKPQSVAVSTFPPLGLLSLAAFLRQRGHPTRVLDLGFPEDRAELAALDPSAPPLAFGLTATTPEFTAAVRLARDVKVRFPGVPVVLGGIHATALGGAALDEAGADFGVRGEGEETLAELVAILAEGGGDAALSTVRGLVWRDDDGVRVNPDRPVLPDLDVLPFPAWDSVRSERYFSKPWGILQRRERTGFVVTSRGCPRLCSFCGAHATMGRVFRGRSPGLVVDEIEALYRDHGVREILIAEDNVTTDPARAAAICEEILRRGLDLAWRTPNGVRLDTLDGHLVRLMKRSGCYLLGFGLESADPDVLARAGKSQDLDGVAAAVARVRRAGIMTFGTFILGFPGETRRSVLDTVRFATRLELDIAHFGLYAPYPGSADFEAVRDRPELRDWDRYVAFEALPMPGDGLPADERKALLRRAYATFYLRPARLPLYARMLGPSQLSAAARALYYYVR